MEKNTTENEKKNHEDKNGSEDQKREIDKDSPVAENMKNESGAKTADETSGAETDKKTKPATEAGKIPDSDRIISAQKDLLEEKIQPLENGINAVMILQKRINEGMHQELEDYKDKFMNGIHTPLLKNFLRLYDTIQSNLDHIQDADAKERVKFICDELLAILESCDVELMPVGENESFDNTRHKALKRIETEDESLHKKIESVVRRGFYRGEQVLRPQEVTVYFYKPDERPTL